MQSFRQGWTVAAGRGILVVMSFGKAGPAQRNTP